MSTRFHFARAGKRRTDRRLSCAWSVRCELSRKVPKDWGRTKRGASCGAVADSSPRRQPWVVRMTAASRRAAAELPARCKFRSRSAAALRLASVGRRTHGSRRGLISVATPLLATEGGGGAPSREAVETALSSRAAFTGLKPGANERTASPRQRTGEDFLARFSTVRSVSLLFTTYYA